MVQPVDGYLLLSGGTDADIKAIVQGAQAAGARKPCMLLTGTTFKAFIPIDAASRNEFAQTVSNVVGGRAVTIDTFTVACTHLPPGVHICPIKRAAFNPTVNVLGFGLVKVNGTEPGAVDAALAAIRARGLQTASIVEGSATAQIVVEVQENTAANVTLKFALLGQVPGIRTMKVGAHLPGTDGPDINPD